MIHCNDRCSRLWLALWGALAVGWLCARLSSGFFNPASVVGYDFQLRYNEIQCVIAGVDPGLIVSGEAQLEGYEPWSWDCKDTFEWHNRVHRYPPWEYAFMMPFALMPKVIAAHVWLGFELLCALTLVLFAFLAGCGHEKSVWMGCFSIILGTCVLWPVAACVSYLNFGLPIAVAAVLMCFCLDRGKDALAGVFWALMMTKPQLGLIFAVPLLFERKFKTIAVAILVCLGATMVPAAMCGRNPFDMILELRHCGAEYPRDGSMPSMLLPGWFVRWLELGPQEVLASNATTGLLLCSVLTVVWRKAARWLWKILPAMALCIWWTVSRVHDACMQALIIAALAAAVLSTLEMPSSRAFLCAISFMVIDSFYRYGVNDVPWVPAVFGFLPLTVAAVAVVVRRDRLLLLNIFDLLLFPAMVAMSPHRYGAYAFAVLFLAAIAVVGRLRRSHEMQACVVAVVLLIGIPLIFAYAPAVGMAGVVFVSLCSVFMVGFIVTGDKNAARKLQHVGLGQQQLS